MKTKINLMESFKCVGIFSVIITSSFLLENKIEVKNYKGSEYNLIASVVTGKKGTGDGKPKDPKNPIVLPAPQPIPPKDPVSV